MIPGRILAKSLPKRYPEWTHWLETGTEEAFENLYKSLKKPVLKYTLQKVRDREAAEEVSQEIFTKLYRFRDSFDRTQAFSGWFWTLVRNTTIDWIRKHGSTTELAAESVESDGDSREGSLIDRILCPLPNAEALLIARRLRRQLLKPLMKLTRLQRKVVWLKVVHDFSHQEIATALGVTTASVKCVLYRARSLMAPELSWALAAI